MSTFLSNLVIDIPTFEDNVDKNGETNQKGHGAAGLNELLNFYEYFGRTFTLFLWICSICFEINNSTKKWIFIFQRCLRFQNGNKHQIFGLQLFSL